MENNNYCMCGLDVVERQCEESMAIEEEGKRGGENDEVERRGDRVLGRQSSREEEVEVGHCNEGCVYGDGTE